MSRFLKHAVECTLAGETDQLKEVCVGIVVFDRPAGYNPKEDPVVRNEARRLRIRLEQYYASEGFSDTVIISVPRGGYVATFERTVAKAGGKEPAEPAVLEPPSLPTPVSRPRWRRATLVAGAAILTCVFGAARLRRPVPPGFPGVRFSYLTSLPTREIHASISPDGQKVIYSSDQNGPYSIYVTTLDGQSLRLTRNLSDTNELHAAWSPDGRLFAFIRAAGNGFDVIISPVSGGAERKAATIEKIKIGSPPDDVLLAQGSPGPAWSADGGALAFTNGAPAGAMAPIYVRELNSERQRPLTHPAPGENDFCPQYSPDGKWLAFCRLRSNSTSSVYVIPASGGTERQVTQDNEDIRGLAWMPDGRALVVSSNRAGPQRLWEVDLQSGDMSPLPTAGTSARDPSVSRDGKFVVYSDYMLQAEVWEVPLSDKVGAPRNLLPSTRQDHSAQYSPDGKSVAFVSDRSGSWEVWTMLADGTNPRQVTHFDGPLLGTVHWSPDGKYLTFDARPQGHSAIFVISALGGTPREVDANTYEDKMPTWSHDGKWIYFNSSRGGSQELWKIPAAGGDALPVARQFATDSMESPDGSRLFFRGDGPSIWEVPVSGGPAKPIAQLGTDTLISHRMWTVTSDGIWFLRRVKGCLGVWLYDFKNQHMVRKAALEDDAMLDVPGLSVAADGRRLIYSRRRESRSDLMLLRGLEQPSRNLNITLTYLSSNQWFNFRSTSFYPALP
jgi:Tol biopolymer transport system component